MKEEKTTEIEENINVVTNTKGKDRTIYTLRDALGAFNQYRRGQTGRKRKVEQVMDSNKNTKKKKVDTKTWKKSKYVAEKKNSLLFNMDPNQL